MKAIINKLLLATLVLGLVANSTSCMEQQQSNQKNIMQQRQEIIQKFKETTKKRKKYKCLKEKLSKKLEENNKKYLRLHGYMSIIGMKESKLETELSKNFKEDESYSVRVNRELIKAINKARQELEKDPLQVKMEKETDQKQLGLNLRLTSLNTKKEITTEIQKNERTTTELERKIRKLTISIKKLKTSLVLLKKQGEEIEKQVKEVKRKQKEELEKKEAEEIKCFICKEKVEKGQNVKNIEDIERLNTLDTCDVFYPCNHFFHGSCAKGWVRQHPESCPGCGIKLDKFRDQTRDFLKKQLEKINEKLELLKKQQELLKDDVETINLIERFTIQKKQLLEELGEAGENGRGNPNTDDILNFQDPNAVNNRIMEFERILQGNRGGNNRLTGGFINPEEQNRQELFPLPQMRPLANQENRQQNQRQQNQQGAVELNLDDLLDIILPIPNPNQNRVQQRDNQAAERKINMALALQEKILRFNPNNTTDRRVDNATLEIARELKEIIDDLLSSPYYFGNNQSVNTNFSEMLGMAISSMELNQETPEYVLDIFKKAANSGLIQEFINLYSN